MYSKSSLPEIRNIARPQLVQDYLKDVQQWQDDILMQSLFATLPNEEAKPEAFVQKYTFWKDLITNMTRSKLLSPSVLYLPTTDLSNIFTRKGLTPVCLQAILVEMHKRHLWQPEEAVNAKAYSWKLWSNISDSVVSAVSYAASWIWLGDQEDNSSNAEAIDPTTVLPPRILLNTLLIEQKNILLDYLNDNANLINHSVPLTFDEFFHLVNESRRTEGLCPVSDREDILLLLRHLQSEKFLKFAPFQFSENHACAIKIGDAVSITEVDHEIVKIKCLCRRLEDQISELRIKAEEAKCRTLDLLKSGDRKMAAYMLKRKGLFEKLQSERMGALHNLESILFKITSVHSDASVVEAFKAGADTLKELLQVHGLSVEHVDDVVDQLKECIADHDEISAAMTQPISSPIDEDTLTDELNALIEEQTADKATKQTLVVEPASAADGLNELTCSLESFHVSDAEEDKAQEARTLEPA